MDSDDSVCIIPDTPSSIPVQGKIEMRKTNSIINISNDDSFRILHNQNVNLNEPISTGQRSSPDMSKSKDLKRNNVTKTGNMSRSPVFNNTKRQIMNDNNLSQSKERDKQKSKNIMDAKYAALPGSPDFAHERAEILQQKKMENKTSPFTNSKFNLSPFKAGVNRLSSCKPKDNFMWSPSPIKKDSHVKDVKQDKVYSGFVKSSSLLTRPASNASNLSPSASASGVESLNGVKAKKRKIETISSQDNDYVVRPKVQKQKANFSWPSSSDSSDDELLTCTIGNHLKKVEGKTNATEKFKSSCAAFRSALFSDGGNLAGIRQGHGQGFTGVDGNLHRNTGRCRVTLKDRCKAKSSTTGSRSKPINYLDINDESLMSMSNIGDKPKKSVNSSSMRGGAQGHSLSPKSPCHLYSTISPIKSTSPCSKHELNKASSLSLSPKLVTPPKSQTISAFPQKAFSTSNGNNNYRIVKSNRVVAPGVKEISPIRKQRPAHRNNNINNSPLGSKCNPIDVTEAATPETKKALEEIRQMEADEEFARQMQEQLDMEFAMSLQNSESHDHMHAGAHNPGVTGSSPSGATNIGSVATEQSPHWHTPVQVRGRARTNIGGARTRRDRQDNQTDEAVLQLLRQTMETINAELGASSEHDVQFNEWLGNSPHRGARRRRGRGRSRFAGLVYSPAAGGDDYEHLMNLGEMLGEVKDKGLSKSELVRLPVVSYKKTAGQEVDECNICMTDYEEGDNQKILPCFHSFHSLCIDKWIKKNATCPICRVEVTLSQS